MSFDQAANHALTEHSKSSSRKGRLAALLLSGSALAALGHPLPAQAQDAVIDNGDSEAVDGGGGGTQASPWIIPGDLYVGYFGTGSLAITDGGSVSNTGGFVGYSFGSEGTVTVDGAGSSWTNSSNLVVGYNGTGSLTITDGGSVSNTGGYVGSGSNGTVSVDGADSSWTNSSVLFVGSTGTGSLAITNGASVSNTFGFVGELTGSEGTVTVDGAGSSWTNSNELYVGRAGPGSLAITDGGNVSNTFGYVGTYGGSNGTVSVDGVGSSWTNAGELYVGFFGSGTVTVANGGHLESGLIFLANAPDVVGSLNIGAAAMDAATGAGTINAPSLVFGAGAGTLVFNHTDTDYDFDLNVFGPGAIEHYAGTTIVSGDASGFVGTTNVTGGSLLVSGMLGGSTLVGDGALLGGTGVLGNVSVASGGTISPGNSIGTLNVAGDLTFDAGSIYAVEVDPAGAASDLIAVGGAVTINGGNVAHIGFSGDYLPTSTYTIISAGGGVTGAFDGVTSSFAFLDPILGYLPNAVTLTLQRNDIDFSTIALTPNQTAVATAVQGFGFGNSIFDAVVFLAETEARSAFDSLSGEVHPAMRTTLAQDNRLVRQAVLGHMVRSEGGNHVWGEILGNWGQSDGTQGTADIDRDTTGLVAGADFALGENGVIGLAGGYTDTDIELGARSSKATAKTVHVLGYLGYQSNAFRVRAGAGYSHSEIDTLRQVSFTGFSDSLSADYNGETLQAFGEVGYELAVGAGSIEPFAGFSATRIKIDGFNEAGGAAALSGDSKSQTTTMGLLGANFTTATDKPFRIDGRLAWVHAFSGYESSTGLAFAASQPFDVVAASQSRNSMLFDVATVFELSDAASVNVAYHGLLGGSGEDHAATAGLSIKF